MKQVDEVSKPDRMRESRRFADTIRDPLRSFGIVPVEDEIEGQTSTAQLRRARRRRIDEPIGVMSLVDDDGVLRWRIGNGPAPPGRPGRRRQRRGLAPGGRIVEQYKFADLPPNEIGKKLRDLDAFLTPKQGLFAVTRATLAALDQQRTQGAAPKTIDLGDEVQPPESGRVLLLVHGTFSNCENLLTEMAATNAGFKLLRDAIVGSTYAKVLAFNHPTLSVGPVLNAAMLGRHFRGSKADVDVICHSRGGLVTRWWIEALDARRPDGATRSKVVYVGSPLAGTGLAAPHRLKGALDVLTNVSKTLSLVAKASGTVFPMAAPLGHGAGVLFSMFGKITSFAASSPLLDAGVSMIPGLAAQSREGANGEILHLRGAFAHLKREPQRRFLDNYWFVRANFETEDPGWKFWRYFRKDKAEDVAADIVFDGDNDLVVDSESMTNMADGLGLSNLDPDHVRDFGTTASVHHLNYFRQPETFDLIRKAFNV